MKISFSAVLLSLSAVAFGAPVPDTLSTNNTLVKRNYTVLYSAPADYSLLVYQANPTLLPAQFISYGGEVARIHS